MAAAPCDPFPVFVERGEGRWETEVEGQRISVSHVDSMGLDSWRVACQPASENIAFNNRQAAPSPEQAVEQYVAMLKQKGLWKCPTESNARNTRS